MEIIGWGMRKKMANLSARGMLQEAASSEKKIILAVEIVLIWLFFSDTTPLNTNQFASILGEPNNGGQLACTVNKMFYDNDYPVTESAYCKDRHYHFCKVAYTGNP